MSLSTQNESAPHHVVIIGGGFGGLYAAQKLGKSKVPVKVTLIDKRNFHLFQPLLYQVATGSLSPADIASPLRAVLAENKNTSVVMGEVLDIDPQAQVVKLKNHLDISYDSLIVATGVSHHYFGNDQWSEQAPGLKTIEDAINMRRRILSAFEAAEKTHDPKFKEALMNFVVIGGGPTGVELAGTLAELAHRTLSDEFANIDTKQARIILIEGTDRVLPPYHADLSEAAKQSLLKLGVEVKTSAMVTNIEEHVVTIKCGDQVEQIKAQTILWAAGVKASSMGKVLGDRLNAELDRVGRVVVQPDMSIANYPNVYVIGDLANYPHQGDRPLPGVAPVAMQQGEYVAHHIEAKIEEKEPSKFKYWDFGSLAVIGRHEAVADFKFIRLKGWLAWFIWTFVHVYYLIEFDNKLLVMIQWGWNYFTHRRGARIITGRYLQVLEEMEGIRAGGLSLETREPAEVA
ncbi:MAG: NAD(P)/FAD-dependent oxidoreductase [Pseudanabaena sp.]|jgi:NADH dehydrogenase|nr:NAD(P)/FAD-dependent oxidoreductase [Pseudanabaena sp. M179S2SP2A07QC]MCA6531593.1 NAD(P)/FAD-dependent oxidoreductase [Pseudanabaena sp. M125S2SP2A07QC]MCA6533453.1 NAD(P)/FAD-dependent oxidoreductase [Pseudanabaena sp. M176S2SP2A07QC]MCA6539144.1 NAD(P)/FAD-dependent oxidoreductase [Pseudanabaena sp. M037S2SP2A07QC]MCA6542516.1 NAD(P)/FAD-dependent oxidoreductase [Pseudanabaena sp. M074S1SP2A07QC]MCA6548899.1 NAD(P)/FAD-dependent oxidoreductase [Pseudanabaena sp. M152S2SP2A07QC]MCA655315